MNTPFNRPFLAGNELRYIEDAVQRGKLSGNGHYTRMCCRFFEEKYGFKKTLLTTSCTDALEMAALLLNIQPRDEIILPAYTFVSTANAFVLRGAKLVFADSEPLTPNIDPNLLEALITPRTRAIVVVHYGGVACQMDKIMALAAKYNLFVIEDAAQAIDSYYKGRALGSIGHLAAFSFHETKNIICGEGGMLAINDASFIKRAEVIWEKGTNRAAFFRGETQQYNWIDLGSSFLPSELNAAYLFGQLEQMEKIQEKRIALWKTYHENLLPVEKEGFAERPFLPDYAANNGNMYFLLCHSQSERDALLDFLKERGVLAVFHYLTLHSSPFYADKHGGRPLPNADRYANCIIRLPMFYELEMEKAAEISAMIRSFFGLNF